MRGTKRLLGVPMASLRRQPPKVKAFLALVADMAALVFILFIVHDHDNLVIAVDAAHAIGIAKLTKEMTYTDAFIEATDGGAREIDRPFSKRFNRLPLAMCDMI